MGDLGRAIPLYEAVAAHVARVLGSDHPNTLASRNNLAGAYQTVGDSGQALRLHEQTLAATKRVLGPDHPLTRTVAANLAAAQEDRPPN